MVEWPEDEAEPTKYWFSTLPDDIQLVDLVEIAKLRWCIEHDFQNLKQDLGLGHYEGRGWRGFHHHAALRIEHCPVDCIMVNPERVEGPDEMLAKYVTMMG